MNVCSRSQKSYLTLGGRSNHLKHFKDAQRSLHDCYRTGKGASVVSDADWLRLTCKLGNYTGVQKLRTKSKISISAERRGRVDRKTNQEIK
ncbi:hypothetical protein TNCV_1667451 [Trichonephila clavipes]|nr:hypothetical protein TNCV_1667451 [Trichonephila clavipes]